MGFTTCTNTACLKNIFPRTRRSMKDHASVTNHQSWYQFSFVWPSHSHFTHFSTKNTFYYCAQLDDDWMGKQSDCHSVYTKAIMTAEDWPLGVQDFSPIIEADYNCQWQEMLSNGEAFSSRGVLQGRWSALWSKYNKMRTPGTNPPIMCCHQNILSIFEQLGRPDLGIKESRRWWKVWLPEQLETSSLCFDRSQLCPAGNRAQTPARIRPPPCHDGPHRQPRHLRAGPQLHLHVQLRAGDNRPFTFLKRLSLL